MEIYNMYAIIILLCVFPNIYDYNVISLKVNRNDERSSMVLSSYGEDISTWDLLPRRS